MKPSSVNAEPKTPAAMKKTKVKNHAAQILRAEGNQSLYIHKNAQVLSAFYGPISNPNHTNVTKRMQQLHKRQTCIDIPEINPFFKNPFPKTETILTIYFQNEKTNKLSIAASTHRLKPDKQLLAEMENKQVIE